MILTAALLLAQMFETPSPVKTATPGAHSERAELNEGIDAAVTRARALGGTLGVVVIDLGTGISSERNADVALPMHSVQKLAVAVVIYERVDTGTMSLDRALTVKAEDVTHYASAIGDAFPGRSTYTVRELLDAMLERSDNTAQKTLLRALGGVDPVNASLRALGYTGILTDPEDRGFAKPATLASLLQSLAQGSILSNASRTALLAQMARAVTGPGRLRAGFPPKTLVEHKTGTSGVRDGIADGTNDVGIVNVNGRTLIVVAMLHDARGDDAARDAVLADVARAAYDATRDFPV